MTDEPKAPECPLTPEPQPGWLAEFIRIGTAEANLNPKEQATP